MLSTKTKIYPLKVWLINSGFNYFFLKRRSKSLRGSVKSRFGKFLVTSSLEYPYGPVYGTVNLRKGASLVEAGNSKS